jgi:low temperature requirement protein LtrA
MVAGIIVTAAADEKLLADPGATPTTSAAWMMLGGPALFLAGHAAFKYVVWGYVSWSRLAAVAALALLALAAKAMPALALAGCAAALVAVVVAADRLLTVRAGVPGPGVRSARTR